MEYFIETFENRLSEIDAYLDLLESLEIQVQSGTPQFGEHGERITPLQQKILYSSVYLQLYSLVESTITQCVDYVSEFIVQQRLTPSELSTEFQREWVRCTARTHIDLNYENRLISVVNLCHHLIQSSPIDEFKLDIGGGGNWDDKAIYKLSKRIGWDLIISPEATQAAKRIIKDDLGALSLIRTYRNKLAHGNLSFSECGGESTTVQDLKDLRDKVVMYMKEIVESFQFFIDSQSFKDNS